MTQSDLAVVVLAAGMGTRMRSDLPKVLHAIAGKPMLRHVLDAVEPLAPERIVVVTGPGMPQVEAVASPHKTVVQAERLGTGHAVMAARDALSGLLPNGDVMVVFGDSPFISTTTLAGMRALRGEGAEIVALGFEPADPAPYGRLLLNDAGELTEVVETADAAADPAKAWILDQRLCNAGALLGRAGTLYDLLDRVGNDNAKGEYYLTEIFGLARQAGHLMLVQRAAEEEVLGVNSKAELAGAEAIAQERLRRQAMDAGVTLIDPATVWLSHDTKLGRDVVVHPSVVFRPGVSVGAGAVIHSFSHLEGAKVAAGAQVGPFARLRPGAELGEGARVGNFVEVKNASLGEGAKANHLTYLGDAEVGAGANVGAGTITCNYDGFGKHRTQIGAGAFIGSNTALVAPVTVGPGAIVGAGSTIVADVPGDALAVARGQQVTKDGAAKKFRENKKAPK